MFRLLILILAAAGVWCATPAAAAQLNAEKLTLSFSGFIADGADVLSADFEAEMQKRLARIEEQADVSVVVVTAPGLQGADSGRLAKSVGEKLQGIGKIRKHWVIFLLVPADRVFSASFSLSDSTAAEAFQRLEDEQKLELGRKIAGIFSEAVTPEFKVNQWEAGMRAGVDAMERYLGDGEQPAPPVDAPAASGDAT